MTTKNKKRKEIIIQNLTTEIIYVHASKIGTEDKDELIIKCYDSASKPQIITLGTIISLPPQNKYIIPIKRKTIFECFWHGKPASCSQKYTNNGWHITFHELENERN